MSKRSPVKFIIALILLIIFLISLGYYSVFFFGGFGRPVTWIIVAGIVATAFYILFFEEEKIAKVPVISDKYRIHLTVFLIIIALLSILLSSRKVVKIPLQYPMEEFVYNPVIPPIIVVSAVTIFVAITTYIKRFYPHTTVLAFALLGIVYLSALPYISPEYSSVGSIAPTQGSMVVYAFSIPAIPGLVIVSALWRSGKMGVAYPFAYSLVLGIVAGVELPASSGVLPVYVSETLGIILLTIPLILLFGMLTVISFSIKHKSESAGKYFIPSLKVTISLILFLITMIITLNYIFQPYYNPHGILLN